MHDETLSWLHHPEHGELPARQLVDCVFALAPNGRILHFHVEQLRIEQAEGERQMHLESTPAAPERSRCQVIPPFVNAFRQRPLKGQ